LDSFAGNSSGQTISIFCFALGSAGRLVTTYQDRVTQDAIVAPDGEPRTAEVYSFPELSIVSLSERQLFDWGIGFTHATIRAAGEELGLVSSAWANGFSMEDAQRSASSRQAYVFHFSQFDRDSVQRAHADYLLSLDFEQLAEIQALDLENLQDQNAGNLETNATQTLKLGEQAYSNLDFMLAVAKFNYTYSVIDRFFTLHAQFLRNALDKIGDGTTLSAINALRSARDELVGALSARAKGELVSSITLLSRATVDAAVGVNSEESYRASRLTNVILGLLLGLAIGVVASTTVIRYAQRQQQNDSRWSKRENK
jgi:hypothetical protein